MDRKDLFADVAAWNTEFSERLTAYQKLIDTHRVHEAKSRRRSKPRLKSCAVHGHWSARNQKSIS